MWGKKKQHTSRQQPRLWLYLCLNAVEKLNGQFHHQAIGDLKSFVFIITIIFSNVLLTNMFRMRHINIHICIFLITFSLFVSDTRIKLEKPNKLHTY